MNATQERLAKTAKKLIEKNGRTLILIKSKETNTDPNKPWRKNDNPWVGGTEITVTGVFINPKSPTDLGEGEALVAGILIDSRYKYVLIAEDSSPGNDYSLFDYIKDNNLIWKIQSTEKLKPGDKTILHLMRLEQ